MRESKSEIDFDSEGRAIWIIHFLEDEDLAFSIGYKDMSAANEARRRWLVGTANDVSDLAGVDRFKDDAIIVA